MSFIRRSMVAGLTTLLVVSLFALAFEAGILRTVGSPSSVKKLLADSGIYNTIVPNALSQVHSISTSAGNISLSDPQLQSAVTTALPPADVQKDANQIIDSVYAWLNGKTATPDFNIDLSGVKNSLADRVAGSVQQRATNLPVCTSLSDISNFNAYSATCLPPGVSPTEVASQAKQQVLNSPDFLGQTNISANDVKRPNSDQNIFNDQLNQLPKQYQKIKKAPYITALIVLLAAIGIIFLSSTRRRGLRRVGFALAIVGVLMLIFAYALNRVTTSQIIPRITISNQIAQNEVRKVITDIERAIDSNYWRFGVLYVILAAIIIGGVYVEPKLKGKKSPPPTRLDPSSKEQPAAN